MDQTSKSHFTKHHQPITGIILVIIGGILLAGNLGLIPPQIWNIIFRWPTVFAVIAIINLVKKKFIPVMVFGLLWAFFVLPDIVPDLKAEEIWKFWPILLILAGILFLNTNVKRNRSIPVKKEGANAEDIIEEVVIFSGNIKRIESNNFRGGEITSIFGGTEIYFNGSKIAPEGAVIELVNIFGGTKLIVPRDWNVRIEVASILGGFADKRVFLSNEAPSSQVLTIKGVTIFGGGELTNY